MTIERDADTPRTLAFSTRAKVGNLKHNADLTVTDLGNLMLNEGGEAKGKRPASALNSKEAFRLIGSRQPVIFLDYDGTLTKIVKDPSKAKMSKETRNVVRQLSKLCEVAILSGRDAEDVKKLVKIDHIAYAGSHGFDILTADGKRKNSRRWNAFLPIIDRAERDLRRRTKGISGVLVERKKFAISVHFRNVSASQIKELEKHFNSVASCFSRKLRKSKGKKVFELLPKVKWNKGKALLYLMRAFGLSKEKEFIPVFLGDDLTDEDAFRVLREDGVGIIVGNEFNPNTLARFSLRNPEEVRRFLEKVKRNLEERKA